MRKLTKYKPLFRGLTATMASILALSTAGYAVADTWRSNVDDILGTQSFINEVSDDPEYTSSYSSIDDLITAARDLAVREGEEGTVILKNENTVLPLTLNATPAVTRVALLGAAGYMTYPYETGDFRAGNADALYMKDAIVRAGFTLDSTLQGIYESTNFLNKTADGIGMFGQPITTYPNRPLASPGDMVTFKVNEVPIDKFTSYGAASGWQGNVANSDVAIVVLCRPAGENNTYKPGEVMLQDGTVVPNQDPLSVTDDEKSLIEFAKTKSEKVVVLLNTGNAMEIKDLVDDDEIDAIAYIGCPNDYQCEGVMNVLTGEVNSTGALSETFVFNNESSPAMMNFGGGAYSDANDIASNSSSPYGRDTRWSRDIGNNEMPNSFLASQRHVYTGRDYIVEAEGIYVGYNYYETRYYDSIANTTYNADGSAGATDGEGWDYAEEVVYPFGYGISLQTHTQKLTNVSVVEGVGEDAVITATVEITNTSGKDGKFLAQLYVQTPYTEYDRTNKVEKSAIQFLNSAKVDVAASQTETVTITVPTKYLASYDYTTAKTYILDGGTYYFAIGNGAHAAVNNILAAQSHTPDTLTDSSDYANCVKTWANGEEATTDTTTYATSATGTEITNVADNADMNYWLEDSVTYLSRQNWQATYPKNYNETPFTIGNSTKKEEWVSEIRGQQYTIKNNERASEGGNNGLAFSRDYVTQTQIDDITDPFWDNLVAQITIDQAIGEIIHGGSRTEILSNVNNPIVFQNEGVAGFTTAYEFTAADNSTWARENRASSYRFNINSQTLLGTSFNPELAYEWGLIEGESGIWLNRYAIWGTGLTQRRTPYNGRNYEYLSEDAMLTNRLGERFTEGTREKGILSGAKHAGFNDQEHSRLGLAVYMTEQKFRETDLRGFQGAMEDGKALAVMIAFNRIGATNAAHHQGMIQTMFRTEWGYKGLISTDMATNPYYFIPEAMIMAGITQVADFATDDNSISQGANVTDAVWPYISMRTVRNDATLVNQARENLKYQLYAFANSGVIDNLTVEVTPWWEIAMGTVIGISAGLTILTAAAYVTAKVLEILPEKKKEEN